MDFHRSSSVCSVSLIFIFCLLIVVVEKHYSAVVQCSNFGTRVRSKIHQGSRAPKEKASPANRPRLVSLCFASIVFFSLLVQTIVLCSIASPHITYDSRPAECHRAQHISAISRIGLTAFLEPFLRFFLIEICTFFDVAFDILLSVDVLIASARLMSVHF